MSTRLTRALAVSLLALAPAVAHAGPPLLCFPMETGGAPSLPWARHGLERARPDYDRSRLAADTSRCWGRPLPSLPGWRPCVEPCCTRRRTPPPPRSSSRRCAIAPPAVATPPPPRSPASTSVTRSRRRSRCATCRREARRSARPPSAGEDGLALIREAIAARGSDPEMEYAAALVTASQTPRRVSDEHLSAPLRARPPAPLSRGRLPHTVTSGADRLPASATASR